MFGVVLLAARAVAGGVGILEISLAFVCALLAVSSVHIALSWERVVVLRMGKLSRVAGPGLYFTIPILEHGTIRVDQRTIATPFYAEKTLTADLVPVTVDAVLFWMVWDAEKACIEVEDYYAAVSFLAQTAMREAVGRSTVAEVALRRDQLDQEIKEEVEREAAAWGIGVISVKVRDIVIPDDLQHVMSLEAQADREKNARMTVASAEADMADMLAEAASAYGDPSAALRLRTMLQQYETVKASKGTVVTVPSALSRQSGRCDRQRRAAMSETRANNPMAGFQVDHSSGLPVWIQVKNRIAYLIGAGKYLPGDKLPTVRALAVDLDSSYNTINRAYMDLEREGYISTRRGKGTFVLEQKEIGAARAYDTPVELLVDDMIRGCIEAGLTDEDIVALVDERLLRRRDGR